MEDQLLPCFAWKNFIRRFIFLLFLIDRMPSCHKLAERHADFGRIQAEHEEQVGML
jgi:hypothetical protein